MNRTANIFAQLGLILAQFAVAAFVKNKGSQKLANAGLAAAQGGLAVWAHSFNPDGTPAATPYLAKTDLNLAGLKPGLG